MFFLDVDQTQTLEVTLSSSSSYIFKHFRPLQIKFNLKTHLKMHHDIANCSVEDTNMPVCICMCVHWAISVFIKKWLHVQKRWQSCESFQKKGGGSFIGRQCNVPELSFRTPAIAAFLQQSSLGNLWLEQVAKSPTQFQPRHLWTFSFCEPAMFCESTCKSHTALASRCRKHKGGCAEMSPDSKYAAGWRLFSGC